MDSEQILQGLFLYLCFIPVLTLHEFAHAWTAWKCGDPTAKNLGRVTINPIAHMEFFGTVVLPLLAIYLSIAGSGLAGFIIGWGKPVPVDSSNLSNPRVQDTLIAMAGPGINLILAVILMAGFKVGSVVGSSVAMEAFAMLVIVNLILAFFNLMPIPPLDGSHLVKNAIGMSNVTFWRLSQFGFVVVILVLQIPAVRSGLSAVVQGTFRGLGRLYGLG
ncbi:MAG TPA: site-2 protease family protein [Methylomirabilota bacterium]|nr:site-2 protease family protein [Methylomirabilota bacterium]